MIYNVLPNIQSPSPLPLIYSNLFQHSKKLQYPISPIHLGLRELVLPGVQNVLLALIAGYICICLWDNLIYSIPNFIIKDNIEHRFDNTFTQVQIYHVQQRRDRHRFELLPLFLFFVCVNTKEGIFKLRCLRV